MLARPQSPCLLSLEVIKSASAKPVTPLEFAGLQISVEYPKGSIRHGNNKHGQVWERKMYADYGYVKGGGDLGTGAAPVSVDREKVDVYVGPDKDSRRVYVVHQLKPDTGDHDEDKVMLGFSTRRDAKEMYLKHMPTPKFFGGMNSMSIEEFKLLLKEHKGKMLHLTGDRGDRVLERLRKRVTSELSR